MILEHALLPVIAGREAEFEATMREAYPLIAATPGFLGLELHRGIEQPSSFLLLVRWESVEAHSVGFRQSDRYPRWRELLHHFYDPFPLVEHYAAVDLGDAAGPAGPAGE